MHIKLSMKEESLNVHPEVRAWLDEIEKALNEVLSGIPIDKLMEAQLLLTNRTPACMNEPSEAFKDLPFREQ